MRRAPWEHRSPHVSIPSPTIPATSSLWKQIHRVNNGKSRSPGKIEQWQERERERVKAWETSPCITHLEKCCHGITINMRSYIKTLGPCKSASWLGGLASKIEEVPGSASPQSEALSSTIFFGVRYISTVISTIFSAMK